MRGGNSAAALFASSPSEKIVGKSEQLTQSPTNWRSKLYEVWIYASLKQKVAPLVGLCVGAKVARGDA
jgi:hypothetical protein